MVIHVQSKPALALRTGLSISAGPTFWQWESHSEHCAVTNHKNTSFVARASISVIKERGGRFILGLKSASEIWTKHNK